MIKNEKKDVVIIICPPLSEYPDAPKDQSHSELRKCPTYKNQMWLSDKKKGLLLFSACLGKEILLGCYDCIKKIIAEDPLLFKDVKKIDLQTI